jgi:hypothetical protein
MAHMRMFRKHTFSKDCFPRDSAASLLESSCEVGCRCHIDKIDHQRESLESCQHTDSHSVVENSATHFLRERISHVDYVLIAWNLADEIGNVDGLGSAGLILQALEALAHFFSIYFDLNLTRKGNVNIESIWNQSRGSSAVEHDS